MTLLSYTDHILTNFALSIRFFHAYAFPEGNSAWKSKQSRIDPFRMKLLFHWTCYVIFISAVHTGTTSRGLSFFLDFVLPPSFQLNRQSRKWHSE